MTIPKADMELRNARRHQANLLSRQIKCGVYFRDDGSFYALKQVAGSQEQAQAAGEELRALITGLGGWLVKSGTGKPEGTGHIVQIELEWRGP